MSTGQGTVAVLFGWKGSHRSDVTLTMCHRPFGISTVHLQAHRPKEGRCDTFIPDIVSGKHGYKNTDWICRCCPKGSKSTTKSSSSPYSEKFESSSEDEGVRDDMLYIAVDSDDEIRVRGVHSDSSSASESSDDSSSSSTANEAQSPREMCEVQDDEKLA